MTQFTATMRQQAALWTVKMAQRSLSARERQNMAAWLAEDPCHKLALAQARQMWLALGEMSPLSPQAKKPPARNPAWGWAVAAMLLIVSLPLILMLPDLALRLQADYYTGYGEIQRITLPDGSQVDLNSRSAIALHYSRAERRVTLLAGEAWFHVAPLAGHQPRPFRVQAAGGITQALGTEFSVERTGDGAQVVAYRHSVRVEHDGQALTLQAPQAASYHHLRLHRLALPASADAWRRGWLVIDKQPVSRALARINRYRKNTLIMVNPALKKRVVSGVFALDNLNDAIDTLCQTLGAKRLNLPGITLLY